MLEFEDASRDLQNQVNQVKYSSESCSFINEGDVHESNNELTKDNMKGVLQRDMLSGRDMLMKHTMNKSVYVPCNEGHDEYTLLQRAHSEHSDDAGYTARNTKRDTDRREVSK